MSLQQTIPYESIAVAGPTACGKTRKAVTLAKAFNGEILSADSRQVYRGMDIGTGKDLSDYAGVKYHLIDIVDAGEKYNLHQYLRDFNTAYAEVLEKGKMPIICGGSGMYLENAIGGVRLPDVPCNPSLRSELESKSLEELTEILRSCKTLHNTTDVDTIKRAVRAIEIQRYYEDHPQEARMTDRETATPLNTLIIALDISRDDRRNRISQRLDARLEEGMCQEVEHIMKSGVKFEDLVYYGLEYKYVTEYVAGLTTREEMHRNLETAIHQFAKRQLTWLRGMERRGFKLHWLPYDMTEEDFVEEVSRLLKNK